MNWIKKQLPAWERERYEKQIAKLERENEELKQQAACDGAYIAGLHESMRLLKRITIHNEVTKT